MSEQLRLTRGGGGEGGTGVLTTSRIRAGVESKPLPLAH